MATFLRLPFGSAVKTILYENDFEHPNPALTYTPNPYPPQDCQTSINDSTDDDYRINNVYGGQGGPGGSPTTYGTGVFGQHYTVEVNTQRSADLNQFWDKTIWSLMDQVLGTNGWDKMNNSKYFVGMLAGPNVGPKLELTNDDVGEDDKLWLDFKSPASQDFFTLQMDISTVNMFNCQLDHENHDYNLGAPVFRITLYDLDVNGGVPIARHDVTGLPLLPKDTADDTVTLGKMAFHKMYTHWTRRTVSFQKGTAENLRIEWDLQKPYYAGIDNIEISTDVQPPPEAELVTPAPEYVAVQADDPSTGAPTTAPTAAPFAFSFQVLGDDPTTSSPTKVSSSKPQKAASHGDPHFKTFSGIKYDFHGGCDLVLFDNAKLANGLGATVHIRTKIKTWWSYIQSAVLHVGEKTLEVMGGSNGGQFWINGKDQTEPEDGTILSLSSEFHVSFHRVTEKSLRFRLDFGKGDAISLETFKDFVAVNVLAKTDQFKGSVGLLGSFPEGKMLARDGNTLIEDADSFGQEWQVLASEPMLFHTIEGPQHPQKCTMPTKTGTKTQRRLGESLVTTEDAAIACAHVEEDDRDACIFDVLATNDKDMAGSY